MTNFLKNNPALLLIDLQQGFNQSNHWGGNRNNHNAETVCYQLLSKWRENNLPIIHIRHASTDMNSPLHPDNPGFEFMELTKPIKDELIITKNVNSGFIGTNLQQILNAQNIKVLVIVGLTTDHCVSTTTRMAGNFGFKTYVVEDATATFDKIGIHGEKYDAQTIHLTALASLHKEFATVICSDDLFNRL
ncbi:cysteine hydrolase [Moraxella nasovis]|uniref:cysteine hydrolase family protein n=1 Tax=Moraxella nasovis TaxID=2904121 RepID=UPI001F60A33D|nr:cysteine hydrolase family protein [Moraxella nasovis]UNU73621.1 cysteine hydrolase [Moraxella nasovis]